MRRSQVPRKAVKGFALLVFLALYDLAVLLSGDRAFLFVMDRGRKFGDVVLNKLTRIEALLWLVHFSQLARDQQPAFYFEKELLEDSQATEAYVSRTSYEAGLDAVKYIYGTEEERDAPRRGRRKWSGWEIG